MPFGFLFYVKSLFTMFLCLCLCLFFSFSLVSVPPSALIERLCTVGTERKEKLDNDTRQYCVENPDLLYTRLFTHIQPTLCLPCAVKIQFMMDCQGTVLQTSYIFLSMDVILAGENCQILRSVFPAALFRLCFVRV